MINILFPAPLASEKYRERESKNNYSLLSEFTGLALAARSAW